MVEEGVATAEQIDLATRYGMGLRFAALGVVEFIDFGGCDILHHASREMAASIDRHRYAAPAVIGRMMSEGHLGLKTGSGFYDYGGRDVSSLPARRVGAHARHAAPRRAVAPAGRRHPTMRIRRAYADLPHGQVHYAECGDAGAPAVLLLHQTPRSWAEYRAVLPLLGARYRAVAMDTVGFGASDPLPRRPVDRIVGRGGRAAARCAGHRTGPRRGPPHRRRDCGGAGGAAWSRVAALVLSSTPFTDAAFRRARSQRPPIDAVEPSDDGAHLAALWRKRQAWYPRGRPDLLHAFVLDAMKVHDVEAGHRAVAAYCMEDRRGVDPPADLADSRSGRSVRVAARGAVARALCRRRRWSTIEGGMVPLPDQLPQAFAQAVLHFLDAHMRAVRVHAWREPPRVDEVPDATRRRATRSFACRPPPWDTSTARCGAARSCVIRHCRTCRVSKRPASWCRARASPSASASGCAAPASASRGRHMARADRRTRLRAGAAARCRAGVARLAFFSPCTSAWVAFTESRAGRRRAVAGHRCHRRGGIGGGPARARLARSLRAVVSVHRRPRGCRLAPTRSRRAAPPPADR